MPTIETERLILRKFAAGDLREVVAWDIELDPPGAEAEARAFLEYCEHEYSERGIGPWAMLLKETATIVGNCGFPHILFESRTGEVNYYVAPRFRGTALAPEALAALLGFGFRDLELKRIQARCESDNLPSERVMQKVGMTFDSLIGEAASAQDSAPKQKLYAILAKDFHPALTGPVNGDLGDSDLGDRSRSG